jgi:hypothetical protein
MVKIDAVHVEINISAGHLWGRVGSIPGQTHSSCDRVGDSLWQRRFPPGAPVSSYIHYKSPNICLRANNVLVDAQLSIQYFLIAVWINHRNTSVPCLAERRHISERILAANWCGIPGVGPWERHLSMRSTLCGAPCPMQCNANATPSCGPWRP